MKLTPTEKQQRRLKRLARSKAMTAWQHLWNHWLQHFYRYETVEGHRASITDELHKRIQEYGVEKHDAAIHIAREYAVDTGHVGGKQMKRIYRGNT